MYCFVIHIKHGYCEHCDDDESERYCDKFQVEYMKSLRVRESSLLLLSQYRELDAPHFLFIYHTLWFQKKKQKKHTVGQQTNTVAPPVLKTQGADVK